MGTDAPATTAVCDFTDALGRVVRFAILPRFTERVAAEAGTHLDRSAFVLLAHLTEQQCRVGELAEQLRLDGSTVSRQVHALEQSDLVRRESDPADRRGAVVAITPHGSATIRQHRQARRKIFAELLSDVPPTEVAAATALLERLADRIEQLASA